MHLFGKVSPKRLSARLGSNQTKATPVGVDVDRCAPLPELLVVVPDSTYSKVHTKLEKSALNGKLKGRLGKGIEVYSFSWMATEGNARFPEAVVALGGWDENVVYRLHPRTGRYIDLPSFHQVITQEMLSDMLVVFHAAGVKSFVVNEKLFNSLQVAESVKVEVAKESPLGGGLSGSIDAAGDHSQARTVVTKKKASFPDPKYQPHVPDTCWYYHNKKLNPHLLTMVARVIDEGPHVHEATIQFSMEDKWVDISDVQVELTDIIGVAARVESKGSSEYDSTFTVKFFDKAKFDNLSTSTDSVGKRVMSTRLSLSTLANQRVAIFKERAAVREDYYVAHLDSGDEVPVDKWSEFYEDHLKS